MKTYFIAVIAILTSGHSVECFSDTCDYTYDGLQYLCGDVCLDWDQLCDCGGQNITRGYSRDKYCCAPASACTRTEAGASCSQGEVLSWDSSAPCNATGRCFNDVLTSQHLHSRYAKYTCQDKCINWWDIDEKQKQICVMGVNNICDGDEAACGPELRCPASATKYNMSTIPVRSYCYDDDDYTVIKNNGSYDLVDRSDEDLSASSGTSAQLHSSGPVH